MRYDYFLIWNHGLKYVDDIRNIIRKNFKIVYQVYHTPLTTSRLIRKVYAHNYVPVRHLKNKTRYLKKYGKEVFFIFVENPNPRVSMVGEGKFRLETSLKIQDVKFKIRKIYDPPNNEHIIHAPDNEIQTNHILKYLKIVSLDPSPLMRFPFYIKEPEEFELKMIPIDDLYCNILGQGLRKVFLTPHYLSLCGYNAYDLYLRKYLGRGLNCDYRKDFHYVPDHNPIIVNKKTMVIQDGVHRAAIARKNGDKKIWSILI